jgi:hypothetical protein
MEVRIKIQKNIDVRFNEVWTAIYLEPVRVDLVANMDKIYRHGRGRSPLEAVRDLLKGSDQTYLDRMAFEG